MPQARCWPDTLTVQLAANPSLASDVISRGRDGAVGEKEKERSLADSEAEVSARVCRSSVLRACAGCMQAILMLCDRHVLCLQHVHLFVIVAW